MKEQYKIINNAIGTITDSGNNNPFRNTELSKKMAKILESLKTIIEKPTTVLVCGEFKRGKSSFINALIGQDICPTDQDICTSVVSILEYGEKKSVTRYFGDFSDMKSENIDFESVKNYTADLENDDTLFLEVKLPNEYLKQGLRIVDTPGVGGLNPRHATLTNYFIPQAEVSLFVTAINAPMSDTEMTFYNKVLQYAKHSAVIVTMSDTVTKEEAETHIQATKSKISKYAKVEESSLDVIAISSNPMKLSNLDIVKSVIAEKTEKAKLDILREYRDEISAEIANAISPIDVQLEEIKTPDPKTIEKLNAKKTAIDEEIKSLGDPNSDKRKEIDSTINEALQNLHKYKGQLCTDFITTKFDEIIEASEGKDERGKWVGEQLNEKLKELGEETALKLNKCFETITQNKVFEGNLRFNVPTFESTIDIKNPDTSMPINRNLTALTSGMGVASLATAIFSITGPWALLIGAAVSIATMNDNNETYGRTRLKEVYGPHINNAMSNFTTYLSDITTKFQKEVANILTQKVQEKQKAIVETINEINNLKQDTFRTEVRKASLEKQYKLLETAKTSIDNLEL